MIYVITHKMKNLPQLKNYRPLQVGAELYDDLGLQKDNSGENISERNANYCELTGLYWIWKNTSDDYKGLVHYRRFFGKSNLSNNYKKIYKYNELIAFLETADIVLPYIEHLKQNAKDELIVRCCTEEIFKQLERILKEKHPDYLSSFDSYFDQNRTVLFNMMFCKRELFDDYCDWLFSILFELEKEVDISNLNDYQKRLYGFLAERLLNVWLDKKNLIVKHVPVINTEFSLWNKIVILRRRKTNQLFYLIKSQTNRWRH